MEEVIKIPAYEFSNLERLEDGLSSLYELKKTCVDPNNHVGELINEYEENIKKIENDLQEKVHVWKTTLLKYWKMVISTIVNNREYAQIKYIFPYRLVDANNTLFTLTATDDDVYTGGVYTETYSIDDLSKNDILLKEISKDEFERIVHKSCDNAITSRINKILSDGSVGKHIITQELDKPKPTINDNEVYVDLGLPSGTLWAKCNLGAKAETDFGKFFQWGDTQGYEGVDEHQFSWEDYKFGNYDSLTKYNNTDGLTLLETSDDPVFAATSGQASMPTKAQLEELVNNTNHEWVRLENGVNGMKFINKNDDTKYIFIPAAGNCYDGSHLGVGSWGRVWSASRNGSNAIYAWYMYFDAGDVSMSVSGRCFGFSVRGVVVPQTETFDEIDDTDDGQPVDLGLPSGTKWMKSNIGATKPSDFGKFFQWGDTQGYKNESEHQFNWEDYKFGNYNSLTKYNNTDQLTLLEPSDDSAVAATSGQASMPTKDQLQELIKETEHRWLHLANGVNGMKFWKKDTEEPTDGDSYIFIPAAGHCYDGGHYGVGSWGDIWSASPNETFANSAWCRSFDAGYVVMYGCSYRCCGRSVRGVINR